MEQTEDNIELIFVNDCTPDNSIVILNEVLATYPHSTKQVKIIEHKKNWGLPSARNSGLKVASGDYVFHCDGDDFLEVSGLEKLYSKAISTDADIVYCDWYLTYENKERYMSQNIQEDVSQLSYLKAILDGRAKYNVWNKLVRRRIYIDYNIKFPDGYGMGEDLTMIMVVAQAEKVSYLPYAVYHYIRTNVNAFTQGTGDAEKLKHLIVNADSVIEFLNVKFGSILNSQIQFFKLNLKFPYLISENIESYKIWNRLYNESNSFIGKNTNISKRSVFIQKLALQKQYSLLRLYNIVVMRWLYNLVYN